MLLSDRKRVLGRPDLLRCKAGSQLLLEAWGQSLSAFECSG